jgi:hypothetical protein
MAELNDLINILQTKYLMILSLSFFTYSVNYNSSSEIKNLKYTWTKMESMVYQHTFQTKNHWFNIILAQKI